MVEIKAVEILTEELEKSENCSEKVNHLSIKIKWGQGELVQLGPLRPFLEKYPELFAFDDQLVKLLNPRKRGFEAISAPNSKASAVAKFGGAGKSNGKGDQATGKEGYSTNSPAQEDSFLDDFLGGPPVKGAFGKGAGKIIKGGGDVKGGSDGKGGYDGGDGGKGKDFGDGKGLGDGGKGKDFGDGKGAKDFGKAPMKGGKQPGGDLSAEERKRRVQEDSMQDSQAQRGIEAFKTNGVEIELSMLSKKIAPGQEARRDAERCLALVRSAVAQQWGQPNGNVPSVEMCGSYAQGLEVFGSAMDLSFRLPAGLSFEDKARYESELRNQLSQKSNFLEVCSPMQIYAHATSPLAIDLKGANLVANVVLDEQRVNRPPNLDEVIKQLCDCCEASGELVRLVKIWSVNHGLANHQEGFIGGIGWVLLVVFFLQKQKLIPPYSYLSQGNKVSPTKPPMPLSSLLQAFFDFLSHRVGAPLLISLWQGEDGHGPPSLFIEDPAHFLETKQQKSLCDSLGEPQWNRIVEESKKAFNRIKVRPGRWFHWAEVFDPTDRKPDKIHGLAQHLTAELPAGFPNAVGAPADSGKGCSDVKGDAKGASKGPDGKGMDAKGMDGKGMDGKGMDGKGKDSSKGAPWSSPDSSMDGKGMDGKGMDGKGMDGKSAPWSGKDSDGKGWSGKDSSAKGGHDDFKGGKSGKESDGKGWSGDAKGWSGDAKGGGKDDSKGSGKDDFKGSGKDDFKGAAKDDHKGGKDDFKGGKAGKDDGKGFGKDDGKSHGKGFGKDDGKGHSKGYGGKGGKPY